jgi:serine/threonine-protein kinase
VRSLLLGRFALVRRVGAGGSGVVWAAVDVRERRTVAVRLGPGVAARVPHPHVLEPASQARDGQQTVSVMRLVRGGSVERLLAGHGALPADYVAVLLDQLLQALGAVHAAGWVHRDVTPANLLLEPTGTGRPHLWLADLGCARPVGRPGPVEGTPGYVAPEARAEAPADPRADLYAAGVTAAELLSGRVPRSACELGRSPLRPVLAALVRTDPGDRPGSAGEALDLLRSYGVPRGTPWAERPHPPDVADVVGRVRRAYR